MKHYKILLLLCSMLYTTNVSASALKLAVKNAMCWGYYAKANMLRIQNSKQKALLHYNNVRYLGFNYAHPAILEGYRKGEQMFVNTRNKNNLHEAKYQCSVANSNVIFISHI